MKTLVTALGETRLCSYIFALTSMSDSLHVPSSPTVDRGRSVSSLTTPSSAVACLLSNGSTYARHSASSGIFGLGTGLSIPITGSFDVILPNSKETLFALVNHTSSTIILVVYSPTNEAVLSKCASLGNAEFGRDRLAWVSWHPLSATDNHLATLTEGGVFCLFHITFAAADSIVANERLEMRLKIRSPEDYSLRCTTAAWMEGAQGIWVGMENGDLLACSPILPFPLRIDRLSASRLKLKPSESTYYDNFDGVGANSLSVRSPALVMINRPPRSWHQRLPHIQGPFLVQPEPLELTGAIRSVHSFILGQFGVTLLAVLTSNGALHLMLTEDPSRRDEDSADGETATALGTNTLTLLETLKIPNMDPSRAKMASCDDGHFLLLWIPNNQLYLISLPWLSTLFSLDEGSREDLNRIIRSKLVASNKALDYAILGRSFLLLVEEGASGQLSIVRKGALPRVAPSLSDPDQHLSLATVVSSSPSISDIASVPLPLPYESPIDLPKLQLPPRLSKIKFIEMTEDNLEYLVSIVERWQQSVLAACISLSRSMKLRVTSLLEAARRQKECALVLLEKRVPTLLKQLHSSESKLRESEAALRDIKLRLGPFCQQEVHRWSEIVGSLAKLGERISRMLPPAPGSKESSKTLRRVEEQLRSHGDLLEHIQQSIRGLCLGSVKGSQ